MQPLRKLLIATLPLLASADLLADIKLPKLVSDDMVLQRDVPVRIWGWAEPGEAIEVSFNGQSVSTSADKSGNWEAYLKPMSASAEPLEMSLQGKNEITLSNILVGEVWIASGQSNMRFNLKYAKNADAEIRSANYPRIRFFDTGRTIVSPEPKERYTITSDVDLGFAAADFDRDEYYRTTFNWRPCNPDSAADFSALAYFFARGLHKELSVPVGVILAARGGSRIESWMTESALREFAPYDYGPELNALQGKSLAEIDREVRKRIQELSAARRAKVADIDERDEGYVEGRPLWHAPSHDSSDWKEVYLPARLNDIGLTNGLDGVIWFRKEFVLPRSQSNRRHATLYLGKIADSDEVWLNGRRLGGVENQADLPRVYDIHYRGLAPEQRNVLVIRMKDSGGAAGFASSPEDFRIQFADRDYNLAGPWKYRWGYQVEELPAGPLGEENMVNQPTVLYNGMIHPARKYTVKGVLWDQGAQNRPNADRYGDLMKTWIPDWRAQFENPDLAFVWVSGLNWEEPVPFPIQHCSMCLIREKQLEPLGLPGTGVAIISKLGDPEDPHYTNKQAAAERLVRAARVTAYGHDLVPAGPLYKSHEVRGDQIAVTFSNASSGLVPIGDDGLYESRLQGFAIAGSDRKFVWADARIEGDTVLVSSPLVLEPVAVRYAWQYNDEWSNLHNREGLPAATFRTDRWERSDRHELTHQETKTLTQCLQ